MAVTDKMIKFIVITAGLLLISGVAAFSVPAFDQPFTVTQPNGTTFMAISKGDEWVNVTETISGMPVIRNSVTQYWEYAVLEEGQGLIPSGRKVGIDKSIGIKPVSLAQVEMAQPAMMRQSSRAAFSVGSQLNVHGNIRVLVILIQFTNRTLTYSYDYDWSNLVFGASGSIKDYYDEASFGQVTLVPAMESKGTANDGIAKVTLGYSHPNTTNTSAQARMVKDALTALNGYIDYSSYDANYDGRISSEELVILTFAAGYEASYSGGGSPQVWAKFMCDWDNAYLDGVELGACYNSGKRGGYINLGELLKNQMMTIGTPSHEMGHAFGLPDLYDRDNSSEGLGNWSIMAAGSWNTAGYSISGTSPAHFDPWSMWMLGWVTPSLVIANTTGLTVPSFSAASSPNYGVFQVLANPNGVEKGGDGEYFLFENRQKTGFDAGLPGSGLMIWHIDETQTDNDDEYRKLVDIEEADNDSDLDYSYNRGDSADPYYAGNNSTFNAFSSPNSNLYNNSASNLSITNIGSSMQTMTLNIAVKTANVAPVLSWTGETNYTTDGLNPETGTQGSTSFYFRVKYTDTNGDGPMSGYPRLHILKGGAEVSGSPIAMTYVSGSYATGATYQWNLTLSTAGTDYSYYFEAKDSNGAAATGAPASAQNAPDVIPYNNTTPVLAWTGETNYTADGLNPETGTQEDTYFDFRVKYTDADGDAPMSGYPRLHIFDGGVEVPGSPITMSYLSGASTTGAIYRWANTFGTAGTNYSYYFESLDSKGAMATGAPTGAKDAPDVLEPNIAPVLGWTGETNYTADGLNPETGTQGSTYFDFRVKYTDANDDAPMSGYPKLHILKGGVEVSGSPITMTYVSGSNETGATYRWTKTVGTAGTDYTYYFEAKDSRGGAATGTPTSAKNAPDVSSTTNTAPVLAWTNEANYTTDGVNPETGTQRSTYFDFHVKYTDANGDAPMSGYPKLHMLKGGIEVAGSPIAMTYVSGSNATGAIYRWNKTFGAAGTDYTYYFEARDSNGAGAAGTPTSPKDAPDVSEIPSSILLVDDDNGESYESYYKAALDANGITYNEWNVYSQGELTSGKAASYSVIIWFTGEDYSNTLTSADQTVLQTFLDNGGRLFLTGQDIGYDIAGSSFFSNYLHADYVQDDTDLYGLNGISGDGITNGLYLGISGGDGASNQYFPSEIDPISPAVSILRYDLSATTAGAMAAQSAQKLDAQNMGSQGMSSSGTGGIRVENGAYKIVFLSFGFEAINSANSRTTLMNRVLSWLQIANNASPALSWTGETNYTTDGVNPETGTQGSTYFDFRVKYTDANGDAPLSGYPKLHILKGGVEVSGSPIAMTYVSGSNTTGAIYRWTKTMGAAGTDYTYYFEAKDSNGAAATGTPTSSKDAPDVLEIPSSILLVDDDNGEYYESYYKAALNANGITYNEWTVYSQGELTSGKAANYSVIIWFTGNDYSNTLTSTDQSVLETFLNNGGRLFLTGQDIGFDINGSSFLSNYLHADYVQDDIELYGLNGISGDGITNGLYLGISGGDGANNQAYPSEIDPISPAVSILRYDATATSAGAMAAQGAQKLSAQNMSIQGMYSSGTGGIRMDNGTYKIVYLAFGFEAINSANSRNTLMNRVVSWLQVANNAPPALSWTGETNYTADGLNPETGYTGTTYFNFRVKYSDANGDSPMSGYPKLHILKGGVEMSGSPITMTYVSGTNTTGAIYRWPKTFGTAGTDYTYYFEARDSNGVAATGAPAGAKDAPDVAVNIAPVLAWTGETNYTADGLNPETGAAGTTYFDYRVKYSDANGDAPSSGYPKVHILKGGVEVSGSPIQMTYVSGAYSTGAIYRWPKTMGTAGTDYTYYFEARDSNGVAAAGTPASAKNAPDVTNTAPVLAWTGETNYTADGLNPETGADGTTYFDYRVKYSDANGDAPMSGYPKLHILKGGIEVSGSPISMTYVSGANTTGAIYRWTKTIGTAGTDYTYYFEARDSNGAAAAGTPASAKDAPNVTNTAPALAWTGETNYTADGLNPETGNAGTTYFDFRVKYSDANNDAPLSGYPKVHILKGGVEVSGSPITMTYVSGAYTSGAIYRWTKTMGTAGTDYTYYFEARDSNDAAAAGTPTSAKNAPDVNAAPVLAWTGETNFTADGLNPETGNAGTTYFDFRVKYSDANGDAPLSGYPKVHILKGGAEVSGSPITMTYVSGSYTSGAIYRWPKTFGTAGTDYTYYFEARDSNSAAATGTPASAKNAPDVTNTAPVLAWTGETNYIADGLNPVTGVAGSTYFDFRVKYSDANGDAPMSGYPRLHILKGGVEMSGSPITMTYVSGSHSTGAIYRWTKTFGAVGTDYAYYFDAKDTNGSFASGSPAGAVDAPDVTGAARVASLSGSSSQEILTLSLNAGWNAVSLPFDMTVSGLTEIISGNATKISSGANMQSISSEELPAGSGIWIYVDRQMEIQIPLQANAVFEYIEVNAGWNMLGNPFTLTIDLHENLSFENTILKERLNFADAINSGWLDANIYEYLTDGDHYFIKSGSEIYPTNAYFIKALVPLQIRFEK